MQGRETFSMTTTSAFFSKLFGYRACYTHRSWQHWSHPAFPLHPAQTVPRPAPASHSSLAPTSQKLGGARDRISSQKVGAQNKNRTGGKSYKIPHNTPLFPGSQGNTSCWFFFLGSTSDSHDTFYQLGSFELGSFNLNPLMSFYVRMFIHLPPSFQKHPLVFNALFLGLALQLSKLQPKHG